VQRWAYRQAEVLHKNGNKLHYSHVFALRLLDKIKKTLDYQYDNQAFVILTPQYKTLK
jgi:hypothetical protein